MKRTHKRLLSLLLTGAMALALMAGCGQNTASSGSGAAASGSSTSGASGSEAGSSDFTMRRCSTTSWPLKLAG